MRFKFESIKVGDLLKKRLRKKGFFIRGNSNAEFELELNIICVFEFMRSFFYLFKNSSPFMSTKVKTDFESI